MKIIKKIITLLMFIFLSMNQINSYQIDYHPFTNSTLINNNYVKSGLGCATLAIFSYIIYKKIFIKKKIIKFYDEDGNEISFFYTLHKPLNTNKSKADNEKPPSKKCDQPKEFKTFQITPNFKKT